MNAQFMQLATTRIGDALQQQLRRALRHCMDFQDIGAIFASPVDYVGLPLPDYLAQVRRPMDLGLLLRNLERGGYELVYEFLLESDLIWDNARRFNAGDEQFLPTIDVMEDIFLQQLARTDLHLTPEAYRIVCNAFRAGAPEGAAAHAGRFSATRVQLLTKHLLELPEPAIAQLAYWFLERRGELSLVHGCDVNLRLSSAEPALLREFERLVAARRRECPQIRLQRANGRRGRPPGSGTRAARARAAWHDK